MWALILSLSYRPQAIKRSHLLSVSDRSYLRVHEAIVSKRCKLMSRADLQQRYDICFNDEEALLVRSLIHWNRYDIYFTTTYS